MLRIFFVLFIASCFPAAGCQTNPHIVTPPLPDGQADGAALPTAQGACDEMAAIGCLVRSTCASTIEKVNTDSQHFTHIDVACISHAKNAQEVIACGVDCTMTPRTSTPMMTGDRGAGQ